MLIGIALVVNWSRGPTLLYAYPPEPQPVPRTLTPLESSKETGESFYSRINAASQATHSRAKRARDRKNKRKDHESSTSRDLSYIRVRASSLASLLLPGKESMDQPFELVLDQVAFIGHPCNLRSEEVPASGTSTGRTRDPNNDVHSFNLSFIIDTPPDSPLTASLGRYYRDCVLPMTAVLKRLEATTHWLSINALKIADERANLPQGTPLVYSSTTPLANMIEFMYVSLKRDGHVAFTVSEIPVQLILRGDYGRDEFAVALDDEDEEDFDYAYDSPANKSSLDTPLNEKTSSELRPRRRADPLNMWQTLLPLEDPAELKNCVPFGTAVWRFLDAWSPMLPFSELATRIGDQPDRPLVLTRVVRQLVHWNKGKIVDSVEPSKVYRINPDFDVSRLPHLSVKFSVDFDPLLFPPLPIILANIAHDIPFDTALSRAFYASGLPPPGTAQTYINVIVWLFQNSLLVSLRVYLRVFVPLWLKEKYRVPVSERPEAMSSFLFPWSGLSPAPDQRRPAGFVESPADAPDPSLMSGIDIHTSQSTHGSARAAAASLDNKKDDGVSRSFPDASSYLDSSFRNASSASPYSPKDSPQQDLVDQMAMHILLPDKARYPQSPPLKDPEPFGSDSAKGSTSASLMTHAQLKASRMASALASARPMRDALGRHGSPHDPHVPRMLPFQRHSRPLESYRVSTHNSTSKLSFAPSDHDLDLDSDKPLIIADPSRPSASEKLLLDDIATQPSDTALHALFYRMLPYLNGSHHLDEIFYHGEFSSVPPAQIDALLRAYEDFLIFFRIPAQD